MSRDIVWRIINDVNALTMLCKMYVGVIWFADLFIYAWLNQRK